MATLSRTIEVIERGLTDGLHIGAQAHVSRGDDVVANLAIGEARPGVAMETGTILPWLSAGKPVTAVAIGQLYEHSGLDLNDPVAKYIPEFAANDKQEITIRHLLTHTSGIRLIDTGYPNVPWDETIRRICTMRIEPRWEVGQSAGYHIATSWFVLGEIIQRITGQPVGDYLREHIFLPIGMDDAYLVMTGEEYDRYGDRIGQMQNTMRRPPVSADLDTRQRAGAPNPGAGMRGPAEQLGRFYRCLLNGGPPLLSPQTVQLFTSAQRVGLYDQTFKHVIDWGFGFITNTQPDDPARPYGFGPHASPKTFGHGGSQSSVGFADPAHDLTVAIIFNGVPGEPRHQTRIRETLAAVYEDLCLAQN